MAEPTERDLILELAKAPAGSVLPLSNRRWGSLVREYGTHLGSGTYRILGQRVRLTSRWRDLLT